MTNGNGIRPLIEGSCPSAYGHTVTTLYIRTCIITNSNRICCDTLSSQLPQGYIGWPTGVVFICDQCPGGAAPANTVAGIGQASPCCGAIAILYSAGIAF